MNPLAYPLIFLFVGGGLLAALICLLTATVKSGRRARINLSAVALLALLLQKGCWAAAVDFGKGFGGSDGADGLLPVANIALVIGLIWAGILIVRTVRS